MNDPMPLPAKVDLLDVDAVKAAGLSADAVSLRLLAEHEDLEAEELKEAVGVR